LGKTASGGCSAGQGSSEPVAPRIKKCEMVSDEVLEKNGFINNKITVYRKWAMKVIKNLRVDSFFI
jgi:hypothetical protein